MIRDSSAPETAHQRQARLCRALIVAMYDRVFRIFADNGRPGILGSVFASSTFRNRHGRGRI